MSAKENCTMKFKAPRRSYELLYSIVPFRISFQFHCFIFRMAVQHDSAEVGPSHPEHSYKRSIRTMAV